MKRGHLWKAGISSSLTTAVFAVYIAVLEQGGIDNLDIYTKILMSVFIGLLTPVLAASLTNTILLTGWGKSLIYERSFIEGYWLFEARRILIDGVVCDEGHPEVPAVVWFEHYKDGSIRPHFFRTRRDEQQIGWSHSFSIHADIRDDGAYFNRAQVFDMHVFRELIGWGHFQTDGGEYAPKQYSGFVALAGGNALWRQEGRKIHKEKVNELKKLHGDNWKEKALENIEAL